MSLKDEIILFLEDKEATASRPELKEYFTRRLEEIRKAEST